MKMRLVSGFSFLVFLLVGCSSNGDLNVRPLSSVEQNLVTSSNEFGFNLFRQVISQGDGANEFISPLSVSVAFGMLQNGAAGNTLDQMKSVLSRAGLSQQEINQGYQELMELLVNMDPKVQMEIANSIWYRQGFSVLPAFIDTNKTYFDAEVSALDFDNQQSSLDTINGWVAGRTHDKIKKILDQIEADDVMFLINAIYFKGLWTFQFEEKDTKDDWFDTGSGKKPIKMMNQEGTFDYLETEEFQAVDLPYGGGLYGMTLFLPKAGKTVNDIVAALNDENWQAWMAGFSEQELTVFLPRFELERNYDLIPVLQALGMNDVFIPLTADLSGIDGLRDLYVGLVKHKTYVKVNEEGTEAAAVTAIGIKDTALPNAMRIDRPFVFVIHDSNSKALLFMGQITDPNSK